ncbi:lipase 1 precursor [Aspergillus coremiiformis]|uniref:Lipase 1 n=1 Tax=Aspergillus coremiiformis TaxID=138285 RepID=A0A5N6ZGN4_9EURO|nr:lipase 1 precursor [Aspergillus coremiiformis]
MLFLAGLLPLIGSFLPLVSGLPTSPSATIRPPSQDPFYSAPDGYETTRPGTILRLRRAPGNLEALVGNASAAYNVVYRTTDSQYRPTWSVTTVFIPSRPRPGNTSALLSYQIAYDSYDVDASPSYAMYAAPPVDVSIALSQGWHVNVPDYEGPQAAFTAGVLSGHSTLDSIRSILSANTTTATFHIHASTSRTALWGYSGGALASEWATELQQKYAPELRLAGAALGGLTPNITNVMNTVTGTISAGLVPGSVLGLASQYPDAYAFLLRQLKPDGPHNRTSYLAAQHMTLPEALAFFAGQDMYDYFRHGRATFLAPVVQHTILRDGYMGTHGVPRMPIFAYKAIHDEVSPVADTDALVQQYCGRGATIRYERNRVGGHSAEAINGHARALQFLASVLNGLYSPSGCTIRDVTVNVTDSAL